MLSCASRVGSNLLKALHVEIVPVWKDNYAYLLIDGASGKAAIVDGADADVVLQAVSRLNVQVQYVLTTHHHADHAGGNEALAKALPGVPVLAGDDRVAAVTKLMANGARFQVGDAIQVQVLSAPGHTTGHVLYHACVDDEHVLFSGDTLFAAGCGRLFEGNAEQMHRALHDVCGALPAETRVYPGHEYTLSNMAFASEVDPTNEALAVARAAAKEARDHGRPSIPTLLRDERNYNPFMRCHTPEIASAVGVPAGSSPIEVLAKLRSLKDTWQPRVPL